MSDNQNHPIVLKKTNIKDLIAEMQLLTELSMYGCDEIPGKTIGYNPITKKCVDITVSLGMENGEEEAVVRGADLTHEYVTENGAYRS